MRCILLLFLLYLGFSYGRLWPKGIVHFDINSKDYDLHSQDIIVNAVSRLQQEICVKFFHTPYSSSSANSSRILYINNPDKKKTCQPQSYDFTKKVIDMYIGYKCLNERQVAETVLEMLRASIAQNEEPANSYDLLKAFQQLDGSDSKSLLTASERNYINAHYHGECVALQLPAATAVRAGGDGADTTALSRAAQLYYRDKLWPLGVIMYGVEKSMLGSAEHAELTSAMTSIEMSSCVVFQAYDPEDAVLAPRNLLWFTGSGTDVPRLGFHAGNQSVSLRASVRGSAGHAAHAVNCLMRALGLPMMSNRFDRDNYIIINWKNVEKGKEHLLEKEPEESWLRQIPYDFDSVTHAPANYMCSACELGAQTVQPIQDHLWQRTMTMGHRTSLSPSDIQTINILYGNECAQRFAQ